MSMRIVVAVAVAAAASGKRCDDSCPLAKNGICNDGSQVTADDLAGQEAFAFTTGCEPGTDCSDCQAATEPFMTIEEVEPRVLCSDTCWFARDGYCDDGRDGMPAFCQLGTDCGDCGPVVEFETVDDEAYADYYDDDFYEYFYYGDDLSYSYDPSEGRSSSSQGDFPPARLVVDDTMDEYADDAPFIAARGVVDAVLGGFAGFAEAVLPTVDLEIVIEEDDEYEVIVEDDPRPVASLVFFLGLAGGFLGFFLARACNRRCSTKQRSHRPTTRDAGLARRFRNSWRSADTDKQLAASPAGAPLLV